MSDSSLYTCIVLSLPLLPLWDCYLSGIRPENGRDVAPCLRDMCSLTFSLPTYVGSDLDNNAPYVAVPEPAAANALVKGGRIKTPRGKGGLSRGHSSAEVRVFRRFGGERSPSPSEG